LHKDAATFLGGIVKRVFEYVGNRVFKISRCGPLLDAVYASPRARLFDYVALDYYDPFMAHMLRFPVLWDHEFKNKTFRDWLEASIVSKWWDWRVLPRGLHFFCGYYSRDFAGRDVLIAENGMALRRRSDNHHTHRRDRFTRSKFLRLHVHEMITNGGRSRRASACSRSTTRGTPGVWWKIISGTALRRPTPR